MAPPEEPSLSLVEWPVLCVVREQPRRGRAIARLLDSDGSLGQVWRAHKPVVYQALQRLEHLGMVRSEQRQVPNQGPGRPLIVATLSGREAASAWLARPVPHTQDMRSELLVKLALLDRAGADPKPLIWAQREYLVPVADAMRERLGSVTGFDRTLALWRFETVSATVRFLDALSVITSSRLNISATSGQVCPAGAGLPEGCQPGPRQAARFPWTRQCPP
jgi:DNA-binding PadR family transcriptional regulator